MIFRSTVLSASTPRFQSCASNGRLRRDEGLSTSLNSLLSTKRRRWRSESSPLAPLDRGCVEWQPASKTRPSLGFGRRRFLKKKPMALFVFSLPPPPNSPLNSVSPPPFFFSFFLVFLFPRFRPSPCSRVAAIIGQNCST